MLSGIFSALPAPESPEKAKGALLPVGPDSRVPMREVYDMFRATRRPEEVLAAEGRQLQASSMPSSMSASITKPSGNATLAREHITLAAADQFASAGGYMHTVAKVHLGILGSRGR